MNTKNPSSHPWSAGIAAAKANLLPGLILWVAGVLILVAWFAVPPAQRLLQHVADLKTQYGYGYSAIATAFFAGVLPFALQRLAKSEGERHDKVMFIFLLFFWAYKGVEVDALYRLQSYCFGDSHSPVTLTIKIVIDQLVYCPLWAVPTMTLALEWVQKGFDKQVLLAPFGKNFRGWYATQAVPVLISNWAVWIPAVAMIYAMPPALQLPIQNLVACLWVMMVMFMTKPPEARSPEGEMTNDEI